MTYKYSATASNVSITNLNDKHNPNLRIAKFDYDCPVCRKNHSAEHHFDTRDGQCAVMAPCAQVFVAITIGEPVTA